MGARRARRGSSSGRGNRRGLSRRDFLKLSGAGLAGAALLGAAGCSGGDEEQGGGVTNLVFSFGPDPSGNLQEVISRFNEEYQGEIQVEYREMPSDTGEYFNQLRTELQAGASPIDVIGGDVIWPAALAANGWILPLSDRFTQQMRDRFVDAAIQSVTYNGDIWGMPFFTDAGLMYYRSDLLEEAGFSNPPETWDELKDMALETKEKTGTENGFVFQGAEYEGGVVDGLEYIWTHGGEVLQTKEQQDVVANNPDAIAGLRTERSMIEDGVAPVAVTIYKEPETHAIFLNGDAVFCRNWPYMYGLAGDPAASQITTDQLGIAPMPHAPGQQTASGLGGWNLYLNAASEDKADAAWEFMTFAASPEIARFRAIEAGFLPPLQALYEEQSIIEKVPVASFARQALDNARPRPVSPFYSDLSIVMAAQFSRSLQGNAVPEQAAQALQTEMQNIIDLGERLIV
ncbi:MAG: ABC transporter substrate-binding protein [Actinomycetota bacterium]|nr:ABC transporter substrate-binding protein [Actinomycetota bacterium]